MLYTNCTVTINGEKSVIDKPVVLYRGDKEVEIKFYIMQNNFYQNIITKKTNVVSDVDASFSQLVIRVPEREPIFSSVTPVEADGAIIFKFTAEMIDEVQEVGAYDFQIRLLDENKTSRATIPPVIEGIKIKEPIAIENITNTNEVNLAKVNEAIVTTATPLPAFDEQGNYIKTQWNDKDLITDAKLNKIEVGIEGVNQKADSIKTLIPTKTSQLENDSDYATITQVNQAIDNAQLGGGANINDTTASATTTYSSNKIETIKEGLSSQINAIASDVSSSSTLTINDGFTGKVISANILGFKGQVVEVIISCDNSVLADNYSIQIGVTKPDSANINAIWTVTPNKTFRLKLDYNIIKINAWIGSKLGNGDVVLTASIKNIFDYTNELDNKIENIDNKTENIKLFLCDNDFPNVYKVSNSVTIDTIKSFLVNVQGTFKKDEKINIRVDSDCINSDTNIMIGITYPTGDKTNVARVKPNSYIEFTPTENATKIFIWVDSSNLDSTGTVTLSVKNFISLKDKVDKLDNKISKSNRLQGLSFSILGDSYSTYEGWLPSNNASWYRDTGNATPENDVAGVADTWWYKLSKETGLSLLINDSYSGTTVSTSGYNGDDYTPISFITRMVNTLGEKRVLEPKPNIIFIFGGTNDNAANSPIGELKYSDWSSNDLKSFLPAFCYMIAYIKKYNPQARIINITNTNLKSEVSNGMAEACQYYNIENVVLSNIGKTGGHPNKEGMEAIKNQIISIL